MDRVGKVPGVDRSGGVAQVDRRLDGKTSVLHKSQVVLQEEEAYSGSGQQTEAQYYEQRHFTQQQAKAHYYAQQEDKGQYYAEQEGQGAQFLRELAELGGIGSSIPGQKPGRDSSSGQKPGSSSHSGQKPGSGSRSSRKPDGSSGSEQKPGTVGRIVRRRVVGVTFNRSAQAYGKQKTGMQTASGQAQYLSGQQNTWQNGQQGSNYNQKEFVASGKTILEQLKERSEAFKEAMDPKNKKNLYDATLDMMLIEQIEKTSPLKAVQARLLFKIRSVKNSGAKSSEIRIAVSKIKKVIGKAKAKVKNLQKEEQLERKRKRAEENKRKTKEAALRRELERRKKVRKVKERNDVEESKMGLGANYGGQPEMTPAEIAAMNSAAVSTGEAAASAEAGAAVDVAVADVGTAADVNAVDVSL